MKKETISDVLRLEGVNAMGFGTAPKAVMTDPRLPVCAKALYAYLASFCGAGSQAFPGVKKILADLNICKDYYYKNMKLLQKYDYIRVTKQRKSGKFVRNIYTLVTCPGSEGSMEKAAEPSSEALADVLRADGVNAMGFGTVPKAVMTDPRLPVCAKAVYAYLASFCGAGSQAFPGVKKILADLNICQDYYYKNMRLLQGYDYVRVTRRRRAGRFVQNLYTLVTRPGSDDPEPEDKKPVKPASRPCPATRDAGHFPYTARKDTVAQDSNSNRENINKKNILPTNHKVYTEGGFGEEGTDGYETLIRKNIEYDLIITEKSKKEVDSIVRIINDALMSNAKTFRINGTDIPADCVKKRLLDIDSFDIAYILNTLDPPEEIRNIRAYLMTVLYNAPAYSEFYWNVEVRRVQRKYAKRQEEKEREKELIRCMNELEAAATG